VIAPTGKPEPVPQLDAADALRGVVSQIVINGARTPVIVPGSVIEALGLLAELLRHAQGATHVPELLCRAMPWVQPLTEE